MTKKTFYSMIIAITVAVMGAGLFGSPENASAASKWKSSGVPTKLTGGYRTKVVKRHIHELWISKTVLTKEYRLANLSPVRTGKMEIVLMGGVPARKLSSHVYEVKGVTSKNKHVHYYIKSVSYRRLKFSKTLNFAHKPYYYRMSKTFAK